MGIWTQALAMAAQTPAERNRYVDFLRAISILVVVTGHWLIAGFQYVDGSVRIVDVLAIQPGMQWMTWLFQVMPVFFFVGGYANAVSLESASRRKDSYPAWLASRLNRLVTPLLLLIVGWAGLALLLHFSSASGATISAGSRAALIPIWFLAIYIAVVMLAPVTHGAWKRYGFGSFLVFLLAAAATDVGFFAFDLRIAGWSNYFWVWLAVHQLGYAWRDGRQGRPLWLLAAACGGLLALYLLITAGPYPLAMVGSPDEDLSNTLPPKVTLIALGVTQFGLLLAVEAPMRRLLSSVRLWAATVLVNSMIMTLYLWHLTVMVLLVAVAWVLDGVGINSEPGSPAWWLGRPVWIAVLYTVLIPVTALLSPVERRGPAPGARVPSTVRQVGGAILICLGVALLARFGFGIPPLPGLDIFAFACVVVGAGISGLLAVAGNKT